MACLALGCSLGLAGGQTWAKFLVAWTFGFDLLPQIVHVVSAQQQGSEPLHERPDLPCSRHPLCNEYLFTSEGGRPLGGSF